MIDMLDEKIEEIIQKHTFQIYEWDINPITRYPHPLQSFWTELWPFTDKIAEKLNYSKMLVLTTDLNNIIEIKRDRNEILIYIGEHFFTSYVDFAHEDTFHFPLIKND